MKNMEDFCPFWLNVDSMFTHYWGVNGAIGWIGMWFTTSRKSFIWIAGKGSHSNKSYKYEENWSIEKSECWLNFYLLLTECECWMLRSRLCYRLHWHVVHQFPQEFYMNCWNGLSHKTCIVTNLKSMEKIDESAECWLNVDLMLT